MVSSTSVTRLGDFSKFLVTNLLTKVNEILNDILGSAENLTIGLKMTVVNFGQHFISTSGHTVVNQHTLLLKVSLDVVSEKF